jgi:uncharacterized protein (DUF885 family)
MVKIRPILLGLFLGLWATAALATPKADQAFKAIYTREWAWRTAQGLTDPEGGAIPGRLPNVDAASQSARLTYWTQTLKALDAISPNTLSPKARVDYGVYRYQIEALANSQRFKDYEAPFNSDSAFWSDIASTARQPFKTAADYHSFIALMRGLPLYFAQAEDNMRSGLGRGFTPPQVTLVGRDQSVAVIAQAKSAEATVYYKPFEQMPKSIPAAEQASLRAEAVDVINRQVIPAHIRLLTFLRQDYIPKANQGLAATALPDGQAYYRSKIAEYTTLDLSPDQIHAIGLAEVAKIKAEMEAAKTEAGFKGDMPAFLAYLRSDPKFYAKTPQDLLDRAAWIAKQFDGKAGQWFGHLPRARFAIVPVPDEIAPFYTAGRGGTGIYLLNTYDLPSRPLYALTALTLHESAPGHAFQVPLALENKDQPDFRRQVYISAYGEGWALYCEKLGVEMGMYPTAYDRFGMLSYQMWRAARLVIDTGIHAKGWNRQQAIDYLHDHTALSDREVQTEVDRYISWPGQALAYYLGAMQIEASRAKAEAALGPKFNIRAFHDTVLALGSVPLPVLEGEIDQFIASGGIGPYPDEE